MAIKFSELAETHGDAKARQIGEVICSLHGGMGLQDFMSHRGGIDISGCKEADQVKIANLIKAEGKKADEPKQEGAK